MEKRVLYVEPGSEAENRLNELLSITNCEVMSRETMFSDIEGCECIKYEITEKTYRTIRNFLQKAK